MWRVTSTLDVCFHKEIVIAPNYVQLTDKRIYLKQLINRVYNTCKRSPYKNVPTSGHCCRPAVFTKRRKFSQNVCN